MLACREDLLHCGGPVVEFRLLLADPRRRARVGAVRVMVLRGVLGEEGARHQHAAPAGPPWMSDSRAGCRANSQVFHGRRRSAYPPPGLADLPVPAPYATRDTSRRPPTTLASLSRVSWRRRMDPLPPNVGTSGHLSPPEAPHRSPHRKQKTRPVPVPVRVHDGAEDRGRTDTPSRERVFETRASANSATSACEAKALYHAPHPIVNQPRASSCPRDGVRPWQGRSVAHRRPTRAAWPIADQRGPPGPSQTNADRPGHRDTG